MDETNTRIALELEARLETLAELVACRHHPGVNSGPVYWRTLEDTRQTIRHLVESIALSRPSLFCDYIDWLRYVLQSRDVDVAGLNRNLTYLQDAIRDFLPEAESVRVDAYLKEGIDRLPSSLGTPSTFVSPTGPWGGMAESYLDHLLRWNRTAAESVILQTEASGVSVYDLLEHVLEPCQHEIGRLWQSNRITVAQEHQATAITLDLVGRLAGMAAPAVREAGTILATCVEGEWHAAGIRFVSAWLELAGWRVLYTGANTPASGVINTIRAERPDILAVSVTMTWNLRRVSDLVAMVRSMPVADAPSIMVGGSVLQRSPGIWEDLGADGFAPNAREAVEVANRLKATGRE